MAARWAALAVFLCLEVFLLFDHEMGGSAAATHYKPSQATLRSRSIEVFAPDSNFPVPRALIVFFGNDVGFWEPHRRLAAGLARDGYAVVGVDIRPLLSGLPERQDLREQALREQLLAIIDGACLEFSQPRRDSHQNSPLQKVHGSPPSLLLAGHSLGAELALWTAAQVDLPALRGVMAMSPGKRGHLRITAADLLMKGEPKDPGSFAVDSLIRRVVALHPAARIAVIRGANDPFRSADAVLIAAGGGQTRLFGVPLAGHSMKHLALAGLVIRRALDWVLDASMPPSPCDSLEPA